MILLVSDWLPLSQYSLKEDRYEEEIKNLSSKLKEVRNWNNALNCLPADFLFTWQPPDFLFTGLFPVCLLTLLTCWLPVYLVYLLIIFLSTFCLPAHLFYIAASCLPFNFLFTRSPPVFQAETRAEFSERSVAKLEKTIDGLEGESDVFWWLLVKLHLCR